MIHAAMHECGGNLTAAARCIGWTRQKLYRRIKALGIPREHPVPAESAAFEARLAVGEPGSEAVYAFWEGALEEDAELNTVIRLLERL